MTALLAVSSTSDIIRGLLAEQGNLRVDADQIAVNDDLYAAGLSSLSTVDLMLAIEDRFKIEFTSNWLNRRTFASIAALGQAVRALQEHAP